MQPLLSAQSLSKTYPGTRALIDADVEVGRGEVVSLLGENGAGKSTFAKIVCGLVRPDAGELLIEGRKVRFNSPREAQAAGVVMIPQELAYVPDLTAAENIVLGRWPARGGMVTTPRRIRRAAADEMERFGIFVPLDRPLRSLSLADIQLIEILKALRSEARMLVLDEPTAALTGDEAARLLSIVRLQAEKGAGVIFVSHRLDEVRRASERIYVFRDGRITAELDSPSVSRRELLEWMTGVGAAPEPPRASHAQAAEVPVARLRGWRSDEPVLSGFDLDLLKGEVVVLFGLRGCGADAVVEGLTGGRPQLAGTLTLGGRDAVVPRHPRAARRAGIGFVPADRRQKGLLLHRSVRNNLTVMLPERIARRGCVSNRRERGVAAELIERYGIRAFSADQPVATLSGGNQQKVLLASRLAAHPRLLVLQEPTRGVDAGARAQIHDLIRTAAASGAAMLVSTSDVEEAVQIADRLMVLRQGEVVASLAGEDRDEERALSDAVGAADGGG
jgi:ribose transport system ATP-binding protein